MRFTILPAAGLLAVGLAGCGEDSYNNDKYYCVGFGPNSQVTSTISAGCTSCTVSNLAAVIDNNVDSFAGLNLAGSAPGQGVTLRATAPSGTIFPAGQSAGALVGLSDAVRGQLTVNINTYLSGVLQDSMPGQTASLVIGDDGNHANAYYGLTTVKTFDSVEVQFNNASGGTPNFRVHGVCDNGGALR